MKDKAMVSCSNCKQKFKVFSLISLRPLNLKSSGAESDYCFEDEYDKKNCSPECTC